MLIEHSYGNLGMAASPHVLVQDGAGPFINPDNTGDLNFPSGANVTPGNVVSIKLASADSVGQWTLKVVGTDEETTFPALAGVDPVTGIVSTPSTVVTFAVPPGVAGRAYIFQSMVNNGGPAYTTTFGIYTLTANLFRVAALGERFENDSVFGWARTLNQFIKRGGGGGGIPPLAHVLYSTLIESPLGALTWERLTDDMLVGGYRAVADVTARDAIPAASRKVGMWVQTLNNGSVWNLGSDLTTWTLVGGGGGAPTGPAGGDLGGTYPKPEVVGLLGNQIVSAGGSINLNLPLGADLMPGSVFGPLPGSGNPQKLVVIDQYDFIAIRQSSVVVVNVDHVDPTDFVSTVITLTNSGATLDLNLVTILNGAYDRSRYLWFVGDYNGASFYLWRVDSTLASPVVPYQLNLTLPSFIDQLQSITYTDGVVLVVVRDGHDSKYKILKINPTNGAIISVTPFPQLSITPVPGVDLTIPVGSGPRGIGSDGTHVYACNLGDSTVSRILVSTGVVDLVISDVSLTGPSNCIWDGGLYVYISNYSSGIVRVAVATGLVHDTISIPGCIGMARDNSGHVYAINSSTNAVYKIRISDGAVLTSIDLSSLGAGYKNWIAFDNVQYMYVTDYTNGIIRIDVTTDSIFDTIAYTGQDNPFVVEWDHAGHMYVGNEGTSSVSRIRISDSFSDLLSVGGFAPVGLAWDGDHHMYAACDGGGVASIDTATFTQDNFLTVGNSPWGTVWDSHTHVYVVNLRDSTVSRINVSSTPIITALAPDIDAATSNQDYSWYSGFIGLTNRAKLSRFNPSTLSHKVNDTSNIETHPIATDLVTVQVLLNSLKAKYIAHLTQAGVHIVNDSDPNSSVAAIPNATDSTTPVTYPLCAALANDLKAKANAHLTQAGVHAHNDTISIITTPNATASNFSSIITLANAIGYAIGYHAPLFGQYNAHLSQKVSGLAVHIVDDWENTELLPQATDLVTLKALLQDLAYNYTQHAIDPVFHNIPDTVNAITASTNLDADVGQYPTSTNLANALKATLNYHMLKSGVHYHYDQGLVTTPNANSGSYTDLAGVIALANALGYGSTHGAFNNHLSGSRSLVHELTVYDGVTFYDDLTGAADVLLSNAESVVNGFQVYFNSHLVYPGVHQNNDTTNTSMAVPATDAPGTWWPTASALINDIKAKFNAHASNSGGAYHLSVDTGNLVTTPDSTATDLLSIIDLTNALGYATGYGSYNRHRIAVGSGTVVGNYPQSIAWDGGSNMYVTNDADGTVSVISVSTTLVTATVPVDPNPNAVAWDGGLYMYIVCYGNPGTVKRITVSTQTAHDTITVGNGPNAVAKCGSNMYVCNEGDGTISVIDIASGLVTSTITLTVGVYTPFPVAILGVGSNYIYVADASNNNHVIRINVNTLVQTTLGVGLDPDSLAWDGNSTLYVANYGNDINPGTVTEISLDSFTVIQTINVGVGVSGIAFDGGSPGFLYCTNYDDSTVSRIDASTGLVVSTINMGLNLGPNGIAWDDGAHMWVTEVNPNPGTLARIAVSTGTLVLGSFIHAINDQEDVEALPYDGSGVISAATLTAVQARINDLAFQYTEHITNDNDNWHTVPDNTNLITAPAAADAAPTYPTTYTIALELKTKFNAHLTQAGVHYNNDITSTITSTQSENKKAFPAPDPVDNADLTGIVNVIRALATYGYYGAPSFNSNNNNGAYNFHLTQPIEFLDLDLSLSTGSTIELQNYLRDDFYYVVIMAQNSSGVPFFYDIAAQDVDGGTNNPHIPGYLNFSWDFTSVISQYLYPSRFTSGKGDGSLWFIAGGVPDETTLPYTINRVPNFFGIPTPPYVDLSVAIPKGLIPTDLAWLGALQPPIRVSYGLGDYVGDLDDNNGNRDELAKYPMGGALGFSPLPPAGTWSTLGNPPTDLVLPIYILPGSNIGFLNSGSGQPLTIQAGLQNVKAVALVDIGYGTGPFVAADFDGVATLQSGDRVLLARETSYPPGIYTISDPSSPLLYIYPAYGDSPLIACGSKVYVEQGDVFGGRTFQQTAIGPRGSINPQVWQSEDGPHIVPPLTTINGSGAGGTWSTLDTIPGPPANGYDLIVVTDSVATNTTTGDNLQRERGAVTYHFAGGTLSLSVDSRSLTATSYFRQVISGNSVQLQVQQQSSGNNYSFRIRAWFEYVRSV